MSDGMVTAIVVTNLLLGAGTLAVVVACLAGACSAWFKNQAQKATEAKAEPNVHHA